MSNFELGLLCQQMLDPLLRFDLVYVVHNLDDSNVDPNRKVDIISAGTTITLINFLLLYKPGMLNINNSLHFQSCLSSLRNYMPILTNWQVA